MGFYIPVAVTHAVVASELIKLDRLANRVVFHDDLVEFSFEGLCWVLGDLHEFARTIQDIV